jgi:hypothetical protein
MISKIETRSEVYEIRKWALVNKPYAKSFGSVTVKSRSSKSNVGSGDELERKWYRYWCVLFMWWKAREHNSLFILLSEARNT